MIRLIAAAALVTLAACEHIPPPISTTAEHIAHSRLASQCDDFKAVTIDLDSRIGETAGADMDLTLLLEYDRVTGQATGICQNIVDTTQPGLDAGLVERSIERIKVIEGDLFLELSSVS